jgi:anti-sigma factor (TIGR02949 family)
MSLQTIRSECSDVAALLQPYVDGEVQDEEGERVGDHLSSCSPCRAAVHEQLWVRATVRAIERDAAPQALRARILMGLDEIDRQAAPATTPEADGLWTRSWARLRDVLRGGLVMVPAGAVAVALFWVARSGLTPTDSVSQGIGLGAAAVLTGRELDGAKKPVAERPVDTEVLDALAEVEPKVGFPVQVARPDASNSVQLVSARVDAGSAQNASRPGAQLRYKVLWDGRPTHVVDHQLPAGTRVLEGTPVSFGGRQYLLGRAQDGSPILWFERSGVAHMLTHDAPGDPRSVRPQGAEPDYSLLLHFAEHSFSR